MINAIKNVVFLFFVMVLVACGPKKGIVTKKKDSKEITIINQSKSETKQVKELHETTEQEREDIIKPGHVNTGGLVDNYIANYAAIAMAEMEKYKIPASITLAQGILESGSGNGRLAREANNHFGIKCHEWKGPRIYHDDDRSKECFRKYNEPFLSYEDHSRFLTERGRYAFLFDLNLDDYKGWARGLKKAGYATDRKYPDKLIGLIERYELYRFDQQVISSMEGNDVRVAQKLQAHTTSSEVVVKHTVQQGETLYRLAKYYNTTVEDIKKLNNLSGNDIKIGQILILKKN